MRKALFVVGLSIFVAGVLLLPVYYIWCTQFSGEAIARFPVTLVTGTEKLPDGRSFSPGARASMPHGLDLDPSMNPVGFVWHGTLSGMAPAGQTQNSYRASLFVAGRATMQESFSISRDDKERGMSRVSQDITIFTVQQPGRHDFVLEEAQPPRLQVSSMNIEVRRNLRTPRAALLILGGMLMAAGFGLAALPLFIGDKASRYALAATALLGIVGLYFVVTNVMRDTPGDAPVAVRKAQRPAAGAPPAQPAPAPQAAPAAPQAAPASVPQAPPAAAPPDTGAITIAQAEPAIARIGELITLRGTNFSAQNRRVTIGGHGMSVELEVIEWGEGTVKVRIPNDPRLEAGKSYYYRVERIKPPASSNLLGFALEGPKQ